MAFDWKSLVNIIASTVIPIAFPPLAPAIPFIVHGIQTAESMPGATGQEKLQKSIEIANAGAVAANQIHGTDIINVDAMNQVIAAGVSAVVNATNVVHKETNQPPKSAGGQS